MCTFGFYPTLNYLIMIGNCFDKISRQMNKNRRTKYDQNKNKNKKQMYTQSRASKFVKQQQTNKHIYHFVCFLLVARSEKASSFRDALLGLIALVMKQKRAERNILHLIQFRGSRSVGHGKSRDQTRDWVLC